MTKQIKCIREKNTFVRQDGRRKESFVIKYQFRNIDGKEYNIYISSKKRAYIIKTTKSGNSYRVVLPKEISDAILKEIEQPNPSMIIDN